MNNDLSAGPDEAALRLRLNRECARIRWPELQRHFASGAVVAVSAQLDLIEVACTFARDDKSTVAAWLQAGHVSRADDEQAQTWSAQDATLWAVVVAPWVLVQPCKDVSVVDGGKTP